ncbi:hypothetical protein GGR58DRAFT_522442 [Xylaria digitata]|nr:hypothetical protein GGR58DRAFT_522442 [Xylaria digitata]
MVWICNEGFLCECGHWEWDESEQDALHYSWVLRRQKPCFYNLKTDFMENLERLRQQGWSPYEDWRYIITQFSRMRLAYETDKLSVVSGLAQVVQRATERLTRVPGRYLAGLWESELARGLTWRLRRPPENGGLWTIYHFLSWASPDGPISWSFDDSVTLGVDYEFRSEIALTEAHCSTLSPLDPTGQVTSGFLIVSGQLAAVQLADIPGYHESQLRYIRGKDFKVMRFSCDFPEEITPQI